jgi:hypothetical protein
VLREAVAAARELRPRRVGVLLDVDDAERLLGWCDMRRVDLMRANRHLDDLRAAVRALHTLAIGEFLVDPRQRVSP